MNISVANCLLLLLVVYMGEQLTEARVLDEVRIVQPGLSSDWHSVQRNLRTPDTINFATCNPAVAKSSLLLSSSLSWPSAPHNVPCADVPGAVLFQEDRSLDSSTSSGHCKCQCKPEVDVFMANIHSCVAKLDECQLQIPFMMSDGYKRWIPTFSIPATNNIFAPSSSILWNESTLFDDKVNRSMTCEINDVFVQKGRLWISHNRTSLFNLKYSNATMKLMWNGDEFDAQKLEGNIVQLKVKCNEKLLNTYCIAFRIAGIHVNSYFAQPTIDVQWNRIELIICVLLITIFVITLFGGLALWKVCWKSKKAKLISTMQMQFLYHIKQQQAYMQEQLAVIKANFEQRQTSLDNDDPCPSPIIGIQKRKLYFSSEFLDPSLLLNPPPIAEQFVRELRKMIELAKQRIRLKRHVPTLHSIAEDAERECSTVANARMLNCSTSSGGSVEGSSPKSSNSVDSGCESLADEEDEDIDNSQIGNATDQTHHFQSTEFNTEKATENCSIDHDRTHGAQAEGSGENVSEAVSMVEEKLEGIAEIIADDISTNTDAYHQAKPLDNTSGDRSIVSMQNVKKSVTVSLQPSKIPVISQLQTSSPKSGMAASIKPRSNRIRPLFTEKTHRPADCNAPDEPVGAASISGCTPNSQCRVIKNTYAVFPNTDFILNKSIPRSTKRSVGGGRAKLLSTSTQHAISK